MFLTAGPTRPKPLNRPPAAEQEEQAELVWRRHHAQQTADCLSGSAARAFAATGFGQRRASGPPLLLPLLPSTCSCSIKLACEPMAC